VRILILNAGMRGKAERTRMDLLLRLKNWHTINVYGPKEHNRSGSDLAPLEYNEKITVEDIKKEFNPDVFLLVLSSYRSKNWLGESKLSDIGHNSTPFTVLEEDHFSATGNMEISCGFDNEVLEWYKDFGVDLLLRRHRYEEEAPVQSVWLPFSASEKEFFSDDSIERENSIGFAADGARSEDKVPRCYRVRARAHTKLKEAGLLADNVGRISANAYAEYIRKYIGCLACSGSLIHTALAKHFEMMLSKTAVLTNRVGSSYKLFGDKKVYFEYDDSCDNVVDIAKEIIYDTDKVKELTENAFEVCIERHTDDKRAKELSDILECLVEGKEIPRIWGQ